MPSAFAGPISRTGSPRNVDTITVIGYMTHNCVDTTIRHALHSGLAVEYLPDASGSLPYANREGKATAEEIHRVFSVVLQSRFAAVLSTAEWIAALKTGSAPECDSIFQSYQRARTKRQQAR